MSLNRLLSGGSITGITILLFFMPLRANAQIDDTFWFTAPEVTSNHGDEEVVLRLTAFDNDAEVTIALPANTGFGEKTVNVAANTQETFQFSDADIVENKPAGQVNNKGILITSDVDISAYYEVTHGNNPDKFTLKGNNALGTEFFVPSQNAFQNHHYSTPAREHADIVATEDGTQVEITVSDEVKGHTAGSTFTVNLNRGETYSLTATSEAADRHLGGTQITSNKPIAVTISDDSIEVPGEEGCWDLIGDQLIPVSLLGSEYIAMNPLYGEGISNGVHKVFVLAVADGTNLYVNENETPKELEQGDLLELDITDNALYLNSNKPFYAYEVTGIPHQGPDPPTGVELGSAILPNITCTGSSSVSFTRTLNQRFYVQLMTEEKNRDDFQLDGNDNGGGHDDFPDNLNWVQVPGTGDNGTEETWYTATVKLGDVGTGLSTGSPYTISNTEGIFHLSILDENDGSMSFGYFSDYTNLRIHEYELKCMGETLTLETNNTDGTYYWYYEDDMYNPITEDPTLSIEVSEPGKYWVEEDGGCYQTDTVDVEFSMPEFSLGNDTAVCPGESVTWEIEANNADDEFLWQPGNVTSNRFEITPDPDEEVEVSLTMTDDLGCSRTESVTVTGYSPPVIDWNISGEDICLGDTLKTETEMDGYQWTIDGNTDPADTLSYIVPDHSGEYELTVYTEENCSETQSIDLTVHDLPQPNLDDVSECPGEEATFNPGSFDTYLWHDDSENSSYTATSPEKVKVTVTDNNGCVASDSANFEWYNENVFTFGEDTSVCINDDILIAVDEIAAPGENYEWTFSEDGTGPEQILSTTTHELDITNASHSDEGSYTVATVDDNGCDVEDDFYLTVEDTPDLDLENGTDICRGDTIKITTQDHRFVEFEWRNTDDDLLSEENFVLVSEEDTYELTAWQANGCSQTATTEISVYDSPTFDLTDVTVCPNADTGIEMENWSSPQPTDDTREPRDFTWSTGNPRTEHATTEALENPEEGTYYLTVYDERCFHTDSVEVNHYDLPDIELEDDTFCENETFTLQIPSDLETEVNSYFWEQNNSSDTGPSDSDMEVSDEGDYTLHITDNHGCESSSTLTLSHLPVPEFNLGDDRDKCPGDTIMIETDPSFTRYEWNGDSSDDQAYHIEVSSSTTQSLQVWNEEGCTSEDEVSISLLPQPDVDLGGDREGCPGEKFELEVDDYDEIYWTNGDKDIRSITASKGRHGVLVVNEYGCAGGDTIYVNWLPAPEVDLGPDLSICPAEYPVTIEAPSGFDRYEWQTGSNSRRINAQLRDTINMVNVWDENGCQGWDTKGVKTINPPGYSLGDDIEACEPEEIVIDAGTEIVREYAGEEEISYINGYEWNTGSTDQEITVDESGEYLVEVFDGCFYLQDTVQVEYFPAPKIVALDTSIYAQVNVLAEDGTKPYQYALDDDSRMQDESTFKNVEDGTHTVYVEDEKGCRASTEFNIQSEYDISVPGFFTPNNDGHNDTWEIEGIERLPESVISIFDRYGKLLIKYKASDPPWDGEYMGRPVPSDDYWYVIHLKPVDKYLKGNVTIKR